MRSDKVRQTTILLGLCFLAHCLVGPPLGPRWRSFYTPVYNNGPDSMGFRNPSCRHGERWSPRRNQKGPWPKSIGIALYTRDSRLNAYRQTFLKGKRRPLIASSFENNQFPMAAVGEWSEPCLELSMFSSHRHLGSPP